jgi:hypothetical protein
MPQDLEVMNDQCAVAAAQIIPVLVLTEVFWSSALDGCGWTAECAETFALLECLIMASQRVQSVSRLETEPPWVVRAHNWSTYAPRRPAETPSRHSAYRWRIAKQVLFQLSYIPALTCGFA